MKTCKLLSIAVLAMAMSLVSCSGDDGEQGPQGVPGKDGTNGTNGTNGVDGQDGQDGQDGMDGQDKPNVSFYFQDGFKGYDGTQDAQISDAFGNIDDEALTISYDQNNSGDERFALIRFGEISQIINDELLEVGQSCEESYYIDQAILYLYCERTYSDLDNKFWVHFGFYNAQDPLFEQTDATWTMANALEPWIVPGGMSELFAGPYSNTDDYAFKVFDVAGGNAFQLGWVPFQLPRSLVQSWVCDESNSLNKGMRLRLAGDTGPIARMRFWSSEAPSVDLRPLLVIQTEKIDTQSGKGSFSNTKTKDWESMSYEEKMAPLYQYLEMKNSN